LDLVQRSRNACSYSNTGQHPELGWMNAPIQTWFPFSIQICLNECKGGMTKIFAAAEESPH
jgi:hypothetical protein